MTEIIIKTKIYLLTYSPAAVLSYKVQDSEAEDETGCWKCSVSVGMFGLCWDEYGAVLAKDTYHRSSF